MASTLDESFPHLVVTVSFLDEFSPPLIPAHTHAHTYSTYQHWPEFLFVSATKAAPAGKETSIFLKHSIAPFLQHASTLTSILVVSQQRKHRLLGKDQTREKNAAEVFSPCFHCATKLLSKLEKKLLAETLTSILVVLQQWKQHLLGKEEFFRDMLQYSIAVDRQISTSKTDDIVSCMVGTYKKLNVD